MYTNHFLINASMEFICLIFLLVILVSCLMQRLWRNPEKSFLNLVICVIALLGSQLFCWCTDGLGLTYARTPFLFVLNRTMFVLDYSIYFFLSVLFYRFTIALIDELSPFSDRIWRHIRLTLYGLSIWGILISCNFACSMWTGTMYYILPDGSTVYTAWYWYLLPLSLLAPILNLCVLGMNTQVLGRRTTALLALYPFVPLVLLPIDLRYDLCLSYICFSLEMMVIYIGVNINRDREMLKQQAALALQDAEMTHMKVNLLMSQIQPHFLYNALTSIAYLCTSDPAEAEQATNDFANYLRANLKSINATQPIPFDAELLHVENYLKIQQRRFQERLCVEYDIQARDFSLPPLTLQPIVENAVSHGVAARREPVHIRVTTQQTEQSYCICVQDDGPGFDTAMPLSSEQLHIGIKSAKIRLQEMVNGTLDIQSHPGTGTIVTIRLPKQ